jgi:iron uptake system component EfeO
MAQPGSENPPVRRWRRGGRRWALPAGALLLAGASVAAVAVATGGDQARGERRSVATDVEISLGDCGRGWDHPHPGAQRFHLHNTTDRIIEVYLVDSHTGAAYGEVEGLAPGTTRTLRASLGDGSYRFRCIPDDAGAIDGPTVRITGGHDQSGPAVVPVDRHDLIPPTIDYQKWVGGRMKELERRTGTLRDAVRRGDLAAARKAWLPAHLVYERIGAAYGTFGDADQAINGTDAGLPGGSEDPGFTGFHRLEQGLWHGASAAELRPFADRLAHDVHTLRETWSQQRMDPLDMGLRAHEILENTLQFELTGRTDYGSGTNLATARANLDGTEAVLKRLRPLLKNRYPKMDALQASLDRTRDVLDAQHRHGHWTPLEQLTRREREQIDADVGDLVERLADIAAICDVRRTS